MPDLTKGCDKGCRQNFQLRRLLQPRCGVPVPDC